VYSFPDTLHSEVQPMFYDESIAFGFPAGNTIFYSRKDGNWSDIATWETVNGSVRLPGAGDVVYVRHRVNVNINNAICYHMFVSGYLIFASSTVVTVMGNIKSIGTVDMSGGNATLNIWGKDNYIVGFVSGSSGIVAYYRNTDSQPVMNLPYCNLYLYNLSNHFLVSDLSVSSSVRIYGAYAGTIASNLSANGYKVTAPAFVGYGGTFYQQGNGNMLFTGLFQVLTGIFDFSGNPNIEFRGGLSLGLGTAITGNGTWSFTETQTFNLTTANNTNFNCQMLIGAGKTLTMSANGGNMAFTLYAVINGADSGSTLISKALIRFMTIDSLGYMTTGVFDFLTYANTIGYSGNYDFSIPHLSFRALEIGGTGTKSLTGNTVIQDLLSGGGTLNIAAYTLECQNGCAVSKVLSSGGYLKFTTNNQSFFSTCYADIIVSGPIKVSTNQFQSIIVGRLDGDNALSTFENLCSYAGQQALSYQNPTQPMVTGILKSDGTGTVFKYDRDGDQEVAGTTYYKLVFDRSGVKKLMGNVTVLNSYSVLGTASVDLNGFTLTTP
jgi:hypothetical protein